MHSEYLRNLALTLVRVTLGGVFLAHGAQKVLGLFGGPGLQGFASWITTLGAPAFLGYAAALFEFFSGIMLLFGIAAEVGALMVIPVMIGAIALVHWQHGFFGQNNGYEYPLVLLILALVVIIGGPGLYALWNPFKEWTTHYLKN